MVGVLTTHDIARRETKIVSMQIESNMRGGPLVGNDTTEKRSVEVELLVDALSKGDTATVNTISDSLTAHPHSFQSAVPGMLNMVASGNEALRKCAADMLSMRAHWITGPDLNEFLVPALAHNVPAIKDKWTGDLLVTAALSAAPELNEETAATLAGVAHEQLRDEQGSFLSQQSSLGLLSDRMPFLFSPVVCEATQVVLEDFRQSLFLYEGKTPPYDLHSHRILRVALTSLFGQRQVIGGSTRDGDPISEGSTLRAECRRYLETFCNLAERGNTPEWAGAYHMLFTSALVLPALDRRSRAALTTTKEILSTNLPIASDLLSHIVGERRENFNLEKILDDFDPGDVEQTLFFTSVLMDTILDLEHGTQDMSSRRAENLDGQITGVLMKVTDPLVAYFASELRRVVRKQAP